MRQDHCPALLDATVLSRLRPHLRIEIIDQVNGLFNVTALDCFANVHPVCDGIQIHPWVSARLLLKRFGSVHVALQQTASSIEDTAGTRPT